MVSGNDISNNLAPAMDTTSLCQDCGLVFPEIRKMQDHKRVAHDKSVNHCESCDMDVVGLKNFTDHKKRHKQKVCPRCAMLVFVNSWSLQSIVTFNVLRAGYVRKEQMRLTPARKRLSSTCSSSPNSSPRKGFPIKKTHVNRLILNSIDE